MQRRFAAFLGLLFLAGAILALFRFQGLGIRVLNLAPIVSGTKAIDDVAFGPDAWQKLDIYTPKRAGARPFPVIVYFYGGGWTQGSRSLYPFVGSSLARLGYLVVIPDYRKYPEVRFPSVVQDGAEALSWVHSHIAEFGGDPANIFVMGHSAGAHIGALLAADANYLAKEGKDRSAVIRGFVGLAGPYAFTPNEPELQEIFGPPERYPAMQVTTFIDGKQPPMLLLHGDADDVVGRSNLERVASRIQEKGGTVKTIVYPGVDHYWILGAMSWVNIQGPPVLDDIAAFIGSLVEAKEAASPQAR